jgi:hypothetical protein
MEYKQWEKRVDNGAVGEARTKEIIIDRFWVLERSIDRDGADLLVQRKLTSISSVDPPRFGIIQSKFRENIKNIIEINEDYVNSAFFLFVHTGFEDEKKVYFLKADDIKQFPVKNGYYKVKVLEGTFEVESIATTLDELEEGILNTGIEQNQEFVKAYFTGSYYESRAIDENYELSILDSYKVMSDVKDIKEKAFQTIEELIYHIAPLKKIVEEKNPMNLLYLYDDSFDRLNINTDCEEMANTLREYEQQFKEFYYYNKDELYRYNKYIEELGKNRLYLLRELKRAVVTAIENEFKKENIESEDEIFCTRFDLTFELMGKPCIKINKVCTKRVTPKENKYKGNIQYLNIIEETSKINFSIFWGVYQSRNSEELLLSVDVNYELNNTLMKFAEFLMKKGN